MFVNIDIPVLLLIPAMPAMKDRCGSVKFEEERIHVWKEKCGGISAMATRRLSSWELLGARRL